MNSPDVFPDPGARCVRGKFLDMLGQQLQFELLEACQGDKLARVATSGQSAAFSRNQECELFLLRRTNAGHWIASLAPRCDNPWLKGTYPREGEEREGTVVRIADGVAFVALHSHALLDAGVTRDLLPGSSRVPLTDLLGKGDQVRGYVKNVNLGTLRMDLDVASWRRDILVKARAQNKSARSGLFSSQRSDPAGAASPEREDARSKLLSGVRLLLIDNDDRLRSSLRELVEQYSGELISPKVDFGTGQLERAVERALSSATPPTHALVDHSLGRPGLSERAIKMVLARMEKSRVAIFSGGGDDAFAFAQHQGVAFLPKPSLMEDIAEWCRDPEAVRSYQSHPDRQARASSRWSRDSGLAALRGEIDAFLNSFSKRHGFSAGLWFRGTTADDFELQHATVPMHSLGPSLRRIASHSCFFSDQGGASKGQIPAADPAYDWADRNPLFRHYLAIRVETELAEPRAVVMLSSKSPTEAQMQALDNQRAFVRLMVQALLRAEYNDGVETFATMGRLAAGALHEIRNLLLHNLAHKQRLDAALKELKEGRGDRASLIDDAIEAAAGIAHTLDLVHDEAAGELASIRPMRRRVFNVNGSLRRIVDQMQRAAEASAQRETLRWKRAVIAPVIAFEPLPGRLSISIAGSAIEQALINLVDNAIHFAPKDGTGRIVVSACRKELTHGGLELVIRVQDNGDGIALSDQARLFEPRRTTKERIGTGLGLFVSRNLLQGERAELTFVPGVRWGGACFEIHVPMLIDAMDDAMGDAL